MSIFSFFRRHHFIMGLAIVLVVVVSVITAQVIRRAAQAEPEHEQVVRITLVRASDFAKNRATVMADGIIESLQQAELRSQVIAPVAKIQVSVGQKVKQDQVLISLQNADVAAQLEQARAGAAAQEARLAEVRKGARPEDIAISETDLKKAQQDLANMYATVPNALNGAYVQAEDAVRKQVDLIFSDDETQNPQLTFSVKDTQTQIDAQYQRFLASQALDKWKAELSTLSPSSSPASLDAALAHGQIYLTTIRNFLNRTMDAVTTSVNLSQATLDGYKLSLSIARGNVTGALAAVTSQVQGLGSLNINIDRIAQLLVLKQAGATVESIAAQAAAVEQARASVQALEAQLAKTIIRAPFAGTVAAIPVRVGELLTPGQSVVSIVNVNGLQAKIFVSESDLPYVAEGASATLGNGVAGRVARVAPSVNPSNKKVQVDVLLLDPATAGLVVGQNVSVTIAATHATTNNASQFLLPLQTVKISSGSASVYTVSSDSLVVEHAVILGEVAGEFVEVVSGVSADMQLISPVYELKTGQKVVVD